jgi:hypothetical protein
VSLPDGVGRTQETVKKLIKGMAADRIPLMPPVVSRVRRSSNAGQNPCDQNRYDRHHDNHSLSHPDNAIVDRNRLEWSIKRLRVTPACAAEHREGFPIAN